uniref:Attractin n=1 Tax=Aceria tosichella TaxID=561515 RepID=A0A6G1SGD8_9ACAR
MTRPLSFWPTILILILNTICSRIANAGASSTPKNLVTLDNLPNDSPNLTVAAVATSSNQFQNEYQYRQSAVKPAPNHVDRHKSSTAMPSSASSSSSHIDHLAQNDPNNLNNLDYPSFSDTRVMTNVPDCKGRIKLNGTRGIITDGTGHYQQNLQCNWLIDSGLDNATIVFRIHHFSTECNYDTLSIYAGDSVFSKLVVSFSGDLKDFRNDIMGHQLAYSISDSVTNNATQFNTNAAATTTKAVVGTETSTESPTFEIRVASGKAMVVLNSDTAQTMPGFDITYSINSCPLDCSNRGDCDYETLKCKCNASYGDGCQFAEPIKKSCSKEDTSDCVPTQAPNHKSWTQLFDSDSGAIPVRAFHQSVVVDDHMWVFGGRSDESANTNLGIYRNVKTPIILAYDLKKRKWRQDMLEVRGTTGQDHLAELSGHSIAAHGHKLFIYGGMSMNNTILSTLTVFDTKTLMFNEIFTDKTSKGGDEEILAPVSSTGHSANIVDGYMYLFLGYNPKFGYLNFAQKFNIANNSWSIIERRGSSIQGTIGHTSTFDPVARLIYIFGGHAQYQSNKLYSFDPQTEIWTYLKSSPTPRYFHSSIILNSQLLILGQSSYSSAHKSDQCFHEAHLLYDLSCTQPFNEGNKTSITKPGCERACWTTLPAEQTGVNVFKRHGHSIVSYDNKELLLFGGYNGVFMNELWSLEIPTCSSFNSRDECEKPKLALKCDWNSLNSSCEYHDRAFSLQPSNLELDCPKSDTTLSQIACESRETCSECLSTSLGCTWCSQISQCHYKKCKGPFDRAILDYDSCRRDDSTMEPVMVVNETTTSSELVKNIKSHSMASEPDNEIDCKLDNCYLCQSRPQCTWQNDVCTYTPSHLISTLASSPMTPREELIDNQDSKSSSITNGSLTRAASLLQHLDPYNKSYMSLMTGHTLNSTPCEKSCFMRRSCNECTSAKCIWLSSTEQCIESSAYFAYGGHLVGPYVAHSLKCAQASCSDIETCDACLSNPRCGWLNDQSQSGLGRCLDGTSSGPLANTNANLFEPNITTKSEGPLANWFYTSCPLCQCNGHSFCFSKTSICANCLDHTEGSQCSRCAAGFYGNPVNGGICKPCRCSGRASSCKSDTGRCNCNVKGVIGHNCDLCDKANSYVGMPSGPNNGTCYYNLTTDYQYTFNMSKPEDHFYSEINFINVPIRRESDVDFSIACSRLALVDVSIGNWDQTGTRRQIHARIECGSFRLRFAHDQIKANQSFFVHIYNFQTPFILQIAFSQGHRIFLPQFFFTFSSCFLFLFALFGVAWKVKHEFDLYVRNQRRFIEMEQMASRPLSTILLESIRKVGGGSNHQVEPSPIAYEPLMDNNVGVLSVFVQLPGKPNLAIASALVTLTEDTTGSQEDDGFGKRPSNKDN